MPHGVPPSSPVAAACLQPQRHAPSVFAAIFAGAPGRTARQRARVARKLARSAPASCEVVVKRIAVGLIATPFFHTS